MNPLQGYPDIYIEDKCMMMHPQIHQSLHAGDNSPAVSGEEAITLALASLDYLSSRGISTSVSGEEAITLALASLDYLSSGHRMKSNLILETLLLTDSSSGIRSSPKIEVKLDSGDAALDRHLFRYQEQPEDRS